MLLDVGLSIGTVTDVLLTALMTYYLHQHKGTFRRWVPSINCGHRSRWCTTCIARNTSWKVSSSTRSTLVYSQGLCHIWVYAHRLILPPNSVFALADGLAVSTSCLLCSTFTDIPLFSPDCLLTILFLSGVCTSICSLHIKFVSHWLHGSLFSVKWSWVQSDQLYDKSS